MVEGGEKADRPRSLRDNSPPPASPSGSANTSLTKRLRDSFRKYSTGSQPHYSQPASPAPVGNKFHRQDTFIIKVKPGSTFSRFADVVVERKEKLDPSLGTLGELRHIIQTEGPDKVKKFVRENGWSVGHRVRAELWKELCRRWGTLDDARIYYQKECDLIEANAPGEEMATPAFLGGKLPPGMDRFLNEDGERALFRLLSVIEHSRPDFVNAPVLYPLSVLLLHYMDEGDAFGCIQRLLTQGQTFIIQTNIATEASMRTIVVLLKKHASKVYSLLKRMRGEDDDEALVYIFAQWHAWLFRDLPFHHILRVVDCFLVEGQKVLFRVALAVLVLWQKALGPTLKSRTNMSEEEVADEIADFTRSLPAMPEKLLKMAFGVRNLRLSTISDLQQRHELRIRQGKPGFGYSIYRNASQRRLAAAGPSSSALISFPGLKLTSDILIDHASTVVMLEMLPVRLQLLHPVRIFSAKENGISFTRLWQQIDNAEETIVLIQTFDDEVFGAFASDSWNDRKNKGRNLFFGSGESYLFRFLSSLLAPWNLGFGESGRGRR